MKNLDLVVRLASPDVAEARWFALGSLNYTSFHGAVVMMECLCPSEGQGVQRVRLKQLLGANDFGFVIPVCWVKTLILTWTGLGPYGVG